MAVRNAPITSDRLTEVAEQLKRLSDELAAEAGIDPSDTENGPSLVALAQEVMRARSYRFQFFNADLFREPAWEMMLDLFIHQLQRKEVTVSSLAIASGVPHATALRHIARLEQEDIIRRHPDPADSRRVVLTLSPDAARSIETILRRFHDRAC